MSLIIFQVKLKLKFVINQDILKWWASTQSITSGYISDHNATQREFSIPVYKSLYLFYFVFYTGAPFDGEILLETLWLLEWNETFIQTIQSKSESAK